MREWKQILRALPGEERSFGKGEVLHLQGERCETLDLVLDGKLIVQHISESGEALVMETFPKGELLGANLLFSKDPIYPMTVLAVLPTRIYRVEKRTVLQHCQIDQAFLLAFLEEVSEKAILLTKKIRLLSQKTIRESILDFLLEERRRQGKSTLKLPMSKKELAERMGIPRSSFGRELKRMKEDGILDYDARTITLKDVNTTSRK